MARGNAAAETGAAQAQKNSNQFGGNAQALYSTVVPQLTTQAAHPAGYNPSDLAGMQTEAQQTAGGSEAGAVGQGSLLGARTRNAGAPAAAIPEAAREAGQELNKNSLGISNANARLKESQRESALGGLENLTGTETGATNQALGEVAPLVNADTSAKSQSWDWAKNILQPIVAAAGNAKYPGT